MNFLNKFIAGLIVGAAAGAAIALFLQTEKGKEILDDLSDVAEDAGTHLKSNLRNFEEEMSELLKKGKAFVEDLETRAKKATSF